MSRIFGLPRRAPLRQVVLAALLCTVALAAAAEEVLTIGYLELRGDERYRGSRTYARYLTEPLGRPYAGARVALAESRFHGAGAGVTFALDRERGRDIDALIDTVKQMRSNGVRLFLADLPAPVLEQLGKATRGEELVIFNVSAPDDRLRRKACQPHVLHVIPSRAMAMDALGQYLVARKWREVLVLEGPGAADRALAAAFRRTAKRFGLEIVEERPWVLGNDPRERARNNVALLTGGDYDVVFVADTDGEFARDVPYQTLAPRPVVGSEGLAALAWHWAWERHGAPQLEARFEKKAGRPMRGVDWAAWMAVKAVAEAVQRTESAGFSTIRDYLLDPELIMDGFKGYRLNFRPWNHQLRQPLLLGTHNWVVERAPLQGFLHATNNLDTLGYDARDSGCEF